ncbi:hypothetical protein J8273_5793 [Carpediemonas membranifera]|uniref:Uncharacterized protein n=1 Tax=Carpediemonas membranifera TaxID=201153 RepID=A0A8J6E962_9EUKA|nr:hypothetical protein J8273_5793 [Carpediemonas membranifera]|eukprot:KAG9392860.1 hypothetical protein J8273_5793 [Carpediemonas membranifera]
MAENERNKQNTARDMLWDCAGLSYSHSFDILSSSQEAGTEIQRQSKRKRHAMTIGDDSTFNQLLIAPPSVIYDERSRNSIDDELIIPSRTYELDVNDARQPPLSPSFPTNSFGTSAYPSRDITERPDSPSTDYTLTDGERAYEIVSGSSSEMHMCLTEEQDYLGNTTNCTDGRVSPKVEPDDGDPRAPLLARLWQWLVHIIYDYVL